MIKGRMVKFGYPGSPDIIGVVEERFVGIEVKTMSKGSNQRESQRTFERLFTSAGGLYILARTVESAMEQLNQALSDCRKKGQ